MILSRKLRELFGKPSFALFTLGIWVIIFLFSLGQMGAFSGKFLHIGPDNNPDTQTQFLGTPIDTWSKVIILYILGFASSAFSTYYHTVFGGWLINTVRDAKQPIMHISKSTAHILTTLDPIVTSINGVLELFLTLTLQLQFILPQILGDILVSIAVDSNFIAKKKNFSVKNK